MNLKEVSSTSAHIIRIRPAKHNDVYEDVFVSCRLPWKVFLKGRVICCTCTDKGPRDGYV